MVGAYGFSLQRNYVLVIERSHVYMRVTPEEAELVKQRLAEAGAVDETGQDETNN